MASSEGDENEFANLFKLTMDKQTYAAFYYNDVCPELAQSFLQQVKKMKQSFNVSATRRDWSVQCRFCGALFLPGNHTMCLHPMMQQRKNRKIKQLLARQAAGRTMGVFQKRLIQNYQNGTNVIVIKCLNCRKKTKIACQNRQDRLAQREKMKPPDKVLTKSAKKKLKRKQKQRRLDDTPVEYDSSYFQSADATFASPSIVLSGAMATRHDRPPVLTSTPINTSTPIPRGNRITLQPTLTNLPPLSSQHPMSLLSTSSLRFEGSSLNSSNRSTAVNKGTPVGSGGHKKGGVHSLLKNMLTQQKTRQQQQTNKNIQQFFSTI